MLFGDFRFKADDQNSHEGNFGMGFRQMLADGWNAGLYGFFDRRRSPNANLFNQLTFGAELLGTNFDVRANSYWPVGNTVQTVGGPVTNVATASVSGTTLVVNIPATMQTYEYALRGFDAEAGVRIPITPAASPYNLRFYAGGYYFGDPTGVAQTIAGPRLRLEFTDYWVKDLWGGTRFTVSGEWQTDQVRGSQFFAGLRLRVPLQAEARRASFTMQERRMTDSIIRDVDIVANTQSVQIAPAVTENAVSTNGTAITVINSSSTPGGSGLSTAVTNAGANSFVVLSGTFNTTSQVGLQVGQTVMGSGQLNVRTASGRTVTANLNNSSTIASSGATSSVAMNDNSTLTGMTVSATPSGGVGSVAVTVDGVSSATISNNVISSTNTAALNTIGVRVINSSSNIVVRNNNISTSTLGNSVALRVTDSSAQVSGNTLSASGGSTNSHTELNTAPTILSGSTGNVIVSGSCLVQGGTPFGSISYTNGTTCP
jgi:hypothetical protein